MMIEAVIIILIFFFPLAVADIIFYRRIKDIKKILK